MTFRLDVNSQFRIEIIAIDQFHFLIDSVNTEKKIYGKSMSKNQYFDEKHVFGYVLIGAHVWGVVCN